MSGVRRRGGEADDRGNETREITNDSNQPKEGVDMHRPDPTNILKRTREAQTTLATLRDRRREADARIDEINPATGDYRLTERERRMQHDAVRRDTLDAVKKLNLGELEADVLAVLKEAEEYSSIDAVMARSRFVREPSTADSVDTTVNLELLDEMRRARALEEARLLDDEHRAAEITKAAKAGELGKLRALRIATEEAARKDVDGTVKSRSAYLEASKSVSLPKYETWLQEQATELRSVAHQTGSIVASLNSAGTPEPATIAERAAAVAAQRERIAAIPISDQPAATE
jgi:hypothetical protein